MTRVYEGSRGRRFPTRLVQAGVLGLGLWGWGGCGEASSERQEGEPADTVTPGDTGVAGATASDPGPPPETERSEPVPVPAEPVPDAGSGAEEEPEPDPAPVQVEVEAEAEAARASLTVTVVAPETGEPASGVRVHVDPVDASLRPPGAGLPVFRRQAELGEVPLTFVEGRVTFRLPAGVAFELHADGRVAWGGEARAEVAPLEEGEERELVVELQEPAVETVAPSLAPVRGTLVVPAGWNPPRVQLAFDFQGEAGVNRQDREGLDGRQDRFQLVEVAEGSGEAEGAGALVRVPGDGKRFEWSVPELAIGRWRITLDEPAFEVTIDVGPEGLADVRIEVPPPVPVSLRVLDATTGEPLDCESLAWHATPPSSGGSPAPPKTGRPVRSITHVARTPETGTFDFQAMPGEITVKACGLDETSTRTFTLAEGRNELTMEVNPPLGVIVILKEGDAIVPWGTHYHGVAPRRIDGGNAGGRAKRELADGILFQVGRSGRYRIAIPKLDGYLEPAPLELTIEPGPYETHVVQLERGP